MTSSLVKYDSKTNRRRERGLRRSLSPGTPLEISPLLPLIFLAEALSSEIKIPVKSWDLRPINLNKAEEEI